MEHNNSSNKLVLSKQWFIDSHQGNIKDVYHFVERLGSGGFGVVYLAEHRITSKSHSLTRFTFCKQDKATKYK